MGDLLKAKIQQRPDRQELVRQHILEGNFNYCIFHQKNSRAYVRGKFVDVDISMVALNFKQFLCLDINVLSIFYLNRKNYSYCL